MQENLVIPYAIGYHHHGVIAITVTVADGGRCDGDAPPSRTSRKLKPIIDSLSNLSTQRALHLGRIKPGYSTKRMGQQPSEAYLQGPTIVYDGDCPFCSSYVALVRLRRSLGDVTLVNARNGGAIVDFIKYRGLDLDDGMVLLLDGEFFHGEDCVHRMALLSTSSNTFNKVNAWLFRHKRVSAALYPILRAGRNLALKILGRKKLGET